MTWRQYGGSFDNPINPEFEQEARLVEQARAGSERAFSALVARYQQPVFRMILYLVGDVEEARDLARLAIRNALLHMPNVPAGHSIRPWLLRVAVLVALDAVRERGGTPQELIDSLQLPPPQRSVPRVVDADPAESDTMELGVTRMEKLARAPETVIADAWDALPLDVERELIRRLLSSLPEGDAELLALGVVGQIPTRDLAALAGTSQRSIRRRIARALILFQSRYMQIRTDALPPASEAKVLPPVEPNTSPLDLARRGLAEASALVRRGWQGVRESLGEIDAQERLQTLRAVEDDVPAAIAITEQSTQIIKLPVEATASSSVDAAEAADPPHVTPTEPPAAWTAPVPSMDMPDLATAFVPTIPRDPPPPTRAPGVPRVTGPIVVPPDPAPRQTPEPKQRILPRFGPPEDTAIIAPLPVEPPATASASSVADVTTQPLLPPLGSAPDLPTHPIFSELEITLKDTIIIPGQLEDPIFGASPILDAPELLASRYREATTQPIPEAVTDMLPLFLATPAADTILVPPADAVEMMPTQPVKDGIGRDLVPEPAAERVILPEATPEPRRNDEGENPTVTASDPAFTDDASLVIESSLLDESTNDEDDESLDDDDPPEEELTHEALSFALERAPTTLPRHLRTSDIITEAKTQPVLAPSESIDPLRSMERVAADVTTSNQDESVENPASITSSVIEETAASVIEEAPLAREDSAQDTSHEAAGTPFTSAPVAMEREHHAISPPTVVGRGRPTSSSTIVVGNDARADYLSRHKPSWVDAADLGTMPGVAIDPTEDEDESLTPPDAPAPPPSGTFIVPPTEPLDAPRDYSPDATIDPGDLGDITSFGVADASAEE